MNSKSIGNCSGTAGASHCVNPCPPRFIQCASPAEDLHPAPCPALLECGEVSNPKITANFTASSTVPAVSLADVEIDTTCLCYPHVKIEFSTIIENDKTNGHETAIIIQLSRTCNSGIQKVLSTYNLTIPRDRGSYGGVAFPLINTPADFNDTLPFSFIFCAENVPAKDCTYSVDIISVNADGPFIAPNKPAIEFKNTSIAALAVGCPRVC